MLKKTLTLLLILVLKNSFSQYENSRTFYLALGYGFGNLNGTESLTNPTIYSNNTGEFKVRSRSFAMSTIYSGYGKSNGIHLGIYSGATIGGAISKRYYIRSYNLNKDKVWVEEFNFLGDLRLGIQTTYRINEKKAFVGIRYFNNWNGDGLRTYYGNSDDAATIGCFGAFKNISLDIHYASDKIPGFLVDSHVWDFIQTELRCKLANWNDGNYSCLLTFRYEYSILKDRVLYYNGPIGNQKANANAFMISIGIGAN